MNIEEIEQKIEQKQQKANQYKGDREASGILTRISKKISELEQKKQEKCSHPNLETRTTEEATHTGTKEYEIKKCSKCGLYEKNEVSEPSPSNRQQWR